MNTRSLLPMLAFAAVLLHPRGMLHADGGTVRLSERQGDYRITVFTSPASVRVGPVDISVFVQNVANGEPVAEAQVTVRAGPQGHDGETLCRRATTAVATNKLYQAAVFDLAEPGLWDVEIVIEGLRAPIQASFTMDVSESPPGGDILPWIAWPALVIALFWVHQGLVRRQNGRKTRSLTVAAQIPLPGTTLNQK